MICQIKKSFQNTFVEYKYFAFFTEASSYDKSLKKHQTKNNTKTFSFSFIKKNKLRIVYKIIFVQKQFPRCVLQEKFSEHEANPQENNNAEVRSQQNSALKNCSTSAEHPSPGEHLLLHVKRILKDLNYKKNFLQLLK